MGGARALPLRSLRIETTNESQQSRLGPGGRGIGSNKQRSEKFFLETTLTRSHLYALGRRRRMYSKGGAPGATHSAPHRDPDRSRMLVALVSAPVPNVWVEPGARRIDRCRTRWSAPVPGVRVAPGASRIGSMPDALISAGPECPSLALTCAQRERTRAAREFGRAGAEWSGKMQGGSTRGGGEYSVRWRRATLSSRARALMRVGSCSGRERHT